MTTDEHSAGREDRTAGEEAVGVSKSSELPSQDTAPSVRVERREDAETILVWEGDNECAS